MKTILTLFSLVALSLSLCAQGLVSLTDTSIANSTNSVEAGGTEGPLDQPAGTYFFEMLYILNTGQVTPTFNGILAGWTDSTLSGTNSGEGIPTGAYLGHITGENGATGIAVPGWPGGSNAFFVVLGWSANEGTWANVQAALNGGSWLTPGSPETFFGYSMVGNAVAASSPVPATFLFGAGQGLINTGIVLYAGPEPSTMALAGLGGLLLLLFRRRK